MNTGSDLAQASVAKLAHTSLPVRQELRGASAPNSRGLAFTPAGTLHSPGLGFRRTPSLRDDEAPANPCGERAAEVEEQTPNQTSDRY